MYSICIGAPGFRLGFSSRCPDPTAKTAMSGAPEPPSAEVLVADACRVATGVVARFQMTSFSWKMCQETLTVPLQECPEIKILAGCIPSPCNELTNTLTTILISSHFLHLRCLRYISLYERPTQDGGNRLPSCPQSRLWKSIR